MTQCAMRDAEENKNNRPSNVWVRVGVFAGLFALVLAERYYGSHLQLLDLKLSTPVVATLCLAMSGFLAMKALRGFHNGTISGDYTPVQYKRSQNSLMFWFIVLFDGAGAAFLIVASIAMLLGFQ